MSVQHKDLAAGRWQNISFVEQMAHIGAEVERALNWKDRGNADYSRRAYERALELLDFTLDDPRNRPRTKEIARVREGLVDSFDGTNEFGSTDALWRGYFGAFSYAAGRHR
ncbi:MAG: hypothetical protein HY851_04730 [candidate division Zixibacteria bacterium]|nr:hypothetical protein [candidate division Zixibacteria bacterium]